MGEERGWKEKEGDIDRREREIEGRKFKEEGRRWKETEENLGRREMKEADERRSKKI